MVKLKCIVALILFFVMAVAYAAENKPASVLLQEGLYAEEIEGDLDSAIEIYQQIIDDNIAQERQMAQALYRQGMCYMKKQDDAHARENFLNLMANFSDQTNIIAQVQPLLDDLIDPDPAELMPPETILYVELGGPGKQIETILNMLKGSPLENPLAVLGSQTNGNSQDQMGNIISAFLNPSMMAEFQKIKGMAIGITGLPQEDAPPFIVTLFPGKSDALKGLLQMVLNMASQPIESIEGMTCLNLEGGAIAYDDTVYIMVSPQAYQAGQLEWCIKQYKGIINEPTLASSNKSFAKVSKQSRQSNAVTVWADIDKAFSTLTQMHPVDSFPQEIRMANGIIDFQNIDDIIAFLTLEETSLAIEANLALKEGHNNIAYNMIQTPNLSDKGFKAIPSEAVALLSFALNDADSTQAESITQQLKNVTGLDFGRELFANIEQVTVFFVPSNNSSLGNNNQGLFVVLNLGIAITSRNPQQTQQIIDQLLTMASLAGLVSGDAINNQSPQDDGKYTVELNNGLNLNYYQHQNSGTTVLSLNPEIIDASIASLESGNSALTAGPLHKPLSEMSASTSKIVMLNLGGFLQAAQVMVDGSNQEEVENMRNILAQLAEGFSDTTLQLRTNESQNDLNIRIALNDIPPANSVFIPVGQLVDTISQMQQPGRSQVQMIPPAPRIAVIAPTDTPMVIDGIEDEKWSQAESYWLSNKLATQASSDNDISASYKTMWDEDNLYFYIDVSNDDLQSDTVAVFIDADNSKTGDYDDNDYSFNFSWNRNTPDIDIDPGNGREEISSDILFKFSTRDNGYSLEVKFPLDALEIAAQPGTRIGLDVQVIDNDGRDGPDQIITWRDTEDKAEEDTSVFGTAELAGLVGWWKLDEGSGDAVADSSDSATTADGTIYNASAGLGNSASVWYNDPQRGTVLSFNGNDNTGAYVSAGSIPAMTLTNCFTWAFWAKQDGAIAQQYEVIVGNRLGGNDDLQFIKFTPTQFEYYNNEVQDGIDYDDIPDGIWIHHVLVKNGRNLKYYRNGVESGSNTITVTIEANPLYFGGDRPDEVLAGERWRGFLDDVRIYNYALNQAEIEEIYNGSK